MKISELRALLADLPRDLEVYISTDSEPLVPVTKVEAGDVLSEDGPGPDYLRGKVILS